MQCLYTLSIYTVHAIIIILYTMAVQLDMKYRGVYGLNLYFAIAVVPGIIVLHV
jgi:hypothetical protein